MDDRFRYADVRPYVVPDSLGELTEASSGVVKLPTHLAWSGLRIYDLGDERQLGLLYETVIRESMDIADMDHYLNEAVATQTDPNPTTLWKWWANAMGVTPRVPPTTEATRSPDPRPPVGPVTAAAPEASNADQPAPAYPSRRHQFQSPDTPNAPAARPSVPAAVPSTPAATPNTPATTPSNPADTRTAPNTLAGPTSTPAPTTTPAPSTTADAKTLDCPTPSKPDSHDIGKTVADDSGSCSKVGNKTYECTIIKAAYLYHPGATRPYSYLRGKREVYDFLCQSAGPPYSDKNGTSHWWAWVGYSETGTAWISVTSLAGWHDGPQPGLPVCGNSPTTNDSQPPGS